MKIVLTTEDAEVETSAPTAIAHLTPKQHLRLADKHKATSDEHKAEASKYARLAKFHGARVDRADDEEKVGLAGHHDKLLHHYTNLSDFHAGLSAQHRALHNTHKALAGQLAKGPEEDE